MKVVVFEKNGYKYKSTMRDQDVDPSQGILQGPPNLEELDWEAIKRDLHNALFDAGLMSWLDIQQKQVLPGIILGAIRSKLIYLYREAERNG
jgi:hypothetical protein